MLNILIFEGGTIIMKLRLVIIFLISLLLVACQNGKVASDSKSDSSNDNQVSVNKKEEIKNEEVQKTDKNQDSFQTEKPDDESAQIVDLIKKYELGLVEAINKNNFTSVEPYLKKGSPLYESQKKLVKNLFSQGINEELISHEVGYIYYESNDIYRVEVIETIKIRYPQKRDEEKEYQWIYTAERVKDAIKLSKIEKWQNFEDEISKRQGSVKADGYYADEVLGNFDTGLIDSLNKGSSTFVDDIFDNKEVQNDYNTLIQKIKNYGKNFEMVKSEFSDYHEVEPYKAKKKIILSYLDVNSNKKELNLVLTIVAQEFRTGNSITFGGYAKITEIKNVEIQ